MAVINNYFNYSQLAMAAYAELNPSMAGDVGRNIYLAALRLADMTSFQSSQFADTYTILDQIPNTPQSGFSASVFRRGKGTDEEFILSIRGSAPVLGDDTLSEKLRDWFGTNLADIGGDGIAIKQAIDLFNYIQLQTAHAGENVYQYTYHSANELANELDDPTPAFISAVYFKTQTAGVLADKNFTVTGHSTGGHLALILSRIISDRINSTISYSAPGFDLAFSGTEEFFQLLHDAESLATGSSQIITEADGGFNNPTLSSITSLVVTGDTLANVGNKPGQSIELYSEGEGEGPASNHSIREISDALAVYKLYGNIQKSISMSAIRSLLLTGANKQSRTLETVVNSIGELVKDDGAIVKTGDRDGLYTRIQAIKAKIFVDVAVPTPVLKPGFKDLTISALTTESNNSTVSLSADSLKLSAQNSIAYRYALRELNPFVVSGRDSIYTQHNTDNSLDLDYFSDAYLQDRARFLEITINANLNNVSAEIGHSEAIHYVDSATGFMFDQLIKVATTQPAMRRQFVFGTESGEMIHGLDVDDRLYGQGGRDDLFGGKGEDYLEGGKGADRLYGNNPSLTDDDLKADKLLGGEGKDTYVVGIKDTVIDSDGEGQIFFLGELLGPGIREQGQTTYLSADAKFRYRVEGSNLVVSALSGTAGGQFLIKDFIIRPEGFLGITLDEPLEPGNEDILEGDADRNILRAGTSVTKILAKAGDDTISFQDQSSIGLTILAGDGDDTVQPAQVGADINTDLSTPGGVLIKGGAGNDILQGAQRNDQIFAGSGHDTAQGHGGDDTIIGGTGNNWLGGGGGDDNVVGGLGNDLIFGGSAADILIGLIGNDTIYGDAQGRGGFWDGELEEVTFPDPGVGGAFDVIHEAANAGDDVIYAGNGDDKVYGGGGDDTIFGGLDKDQLEGEGGDDTISGDDGDDILWGDINPATFADDNRIRIQGIGLLDNAPYTIQWRLHQDPVDIAGNDHLSGGAGIDRLSFESTN